MVTEVTRIIVFDDRIFFIIDVNECKNATYPCHANATCNNADGSYTCTCNDGYFGDGNNCTGM